MYTLHCTKPLLAELKHWPSDRCGAVGETSTRLGDWYVKSVDLPSGNLFLCTNERSFLSVVVPAAEPARLPEDLAVGVGLLLYGIGADVRFSGRETLEMRQHALAPTKNRSLVAHMNDRAIRLAHHQQRTRDSLEDISLWLAQIPVNAKEFVQPWELALAILAAAR